MEGYPVIFDRSNIIVFGRIQKVLLFCVSILMVLYIYLLGSGMPHAEIKTVNYNHYLKSFCSLSNKLGEEFKTTDEINNFCDDVNRLEEIIGGKYEKIEELTLLGHVLCAIIVGCIAIGLIQTEKKLLINTDLSPNQRFLVKWILDIRKPNIRFEDFMHGFEDRYSEYDLNIMKQVWEETSPIHFN